VSTHIDASLVDALPPAVRAELAVDVALAALTYPQLAQKITAMEDRYGFKFKEKYGLREVIQRALAKAPGLSSVAKIARQSLGR
jgi:hypothetical protein